MLNHLQTLLRGENLSREGADAAMTMILEKEVAAEQIAALLVALQIKTETVDEIVGFAQALTRQARTVQTGRDDLIDICGTGGDGSHTFNISTTVAFVIAAAGQGLAKHGNRAVSSRSGSFDVLESLGVPFVSDAGDVRRHLKDHNLAFLFAPYFHPALAKVGPIRRNLGVRTVFNLLGPLLNPCRVKRHLIGVYAAPLVEKVAHALKELGATEAMVVRGEDGLDELTLNGPTRVAHLKNGKVEIVMLTPEDCGLKSAPLDQVLGGDAALNARILTKILEGEKGAPRDLVLLNAAAALVVGGRARDFKEGVEQARRALDTGAALALLRTMSQAHSPQEVLS